MGLIKPNAERNLTKKIRVASESSMHTLKSTGREGISRGTMEQRRGYFLVLGV